MKVVYDEEKVTFGNVRENQMFVDFDGDLCMKMNDEVFIIIACADGKPCADCIENVDEDRKITRILPKIRKIEF